MVVSGQTFLDASRSFSGTLKELATHFSDQETVSVSREEESYIFGGDHRNKAADQQLELLEEFCSS